MKKIISALTLVVLASGAHAEQCAPTEQVAQQIQAQFGETLSHVGILPNANVLEVYSHPRSKTWTVLVTIPSRGLSCLMATGSGKAALDIHLAALST